MRVLWFCVGGEMQKIQHTALPWAVDKFGSILGGEPHEYANGSKQKQLAMVTANFGADEQNANAAYIVRACNVHYELLEAAKQALGIAESWIHDQLDGTDRLTQCLKELEPIYAAIRKAESE